MAVSSTVGTHPNHVGYLHSPAGADKTVCEVLGKEKESPTQKNCQARANKYFSKPVYGKVILNSIRKEFHGNEIELIEPQEQDFKTTVSVKVKGGDIICETRRKI